MNNLSRDNLLCLGSTTNLSLSVNYIKSKFSEFSSNRTGGKFEPNLGKQPGRCRFRAFITNEARMPQGGDWDRTSSMGSLHCLRCVFPLLVIFFFFLLLKSYSSYSAPSPLLSSISWHGSTSGREAGVIRTNGPEPILPTMADPLAFFTSLVDLAGILLNNHKFLA